MVVALDFAHPRSLACLIEPGELYPERLSARLKTFNVWRPRQGQERILPCNYGKPASKAPLRVSLSRLVACRLRKRQIVRR